MPRCPLFGRYRGKSGSDSDIVKPTRLTQLGHCCLGFVGTLASPPYSSPSCEAVSSFKDDETSLSVDEAKQSACEHSLKRTPAIRIDAPITPLAPFDTEVAMTKFRRYLNILALLTSCIPILAA